MERGNDMTGRMTIERLRDILDAYGGDPLRWPQAERLEAQRLAAHDSVAAALVTEAMAFDGLLDFAPSTEPSRALMASVLAARPKPGPIGWLAGLWRDLFPGTATWKPAVGFALALALGVGVQSAAVGQLGLTDSVDPVSADQASIILAPLSGAETIAEEDLL
jgi:hypothetical protein